MTKTVWIVIFIKLHAGSLQTLLSPDSSEFYNQPVMDTCSSHAFKFGELACIVAVFLLYSELLIPLRRN